MSAQFYRYINDIEKDNIIRTKQIKSSNPRGTWYTTDNFRIPERAQQFLSLPKAPQNRVGPISRFTMPIFDVMRLRTVSPAHGQPGGGFEACTSYAVNLFGIYNFDINEFEM